MHSGRSLRSLSGISAIALVLAGCGGTGTGASASPAAKPSIFVQAATPVPNDSTPTLAASPTPAKTGGFTLAGKAFEFSGAFIPGWYWGLASRTNDAKLLSSAKQAGITVLHLMPPLLVAAKCGVYDQTEFKALDLFLDQASKQNIRVIIPFIHGLAMTQQGHGALTSSYGIETLIKDPKFKACFVSYMKAVVQRVNTVNKRKYSADPTIFGWEIIEEPISGEHNYPVRPPNVTLYEVRQWLDEMAKDLKAMDPNHLVGVQFSAAAIDTTELDDSSRSILDTPSLDFLEIEDGDVRVLQTERSNHLYDSAFKTGKPVVLFLSFTGLSYPDPGQSTPNDARLAKACSDLAWQATTLSAEFTAYQKKGAAGYVVFSWRLPGTTPDPIDRCFSYSTDTKLVFQALQKINATLGGLNSPGTGFASVAP